MKPRLTPYDFHGYQNDAIRHGLRHVQCMYWLDMGLGKSIIGLTLILERLDRLTSFGTLVIAPKRVCRMVWRQEAQKWGHTTGLTFSLIQGTPKERHYAMRKPADVHLLNYENLQWFVDEVINVWLSRGEYPPWDAVVMDEVDKLKDSTGVRSTALRDILPYIPYRIGMTGTPASEGYKDLFGQFLAVDGGARLGTSYIAYLSRYFRKDGYKYHLLPGAKEQIKALIADITFQYDEKFTDDPIINDIYVDLDAETRARYDLLEKEMLMQLDSGEKIEVFNQASLMNKCLQAANGQPYIMPNSGEWAAMHDEKLNALQDIVDESNGQPLLVSYEFKSDLERILKKFPWATYLGGNMSEAEETELQRAWDAGEIRMLIGHPQSIGHGLNLQHGGHIMVWFGLTWARRLYLQMSKRLDRQGQKHQVVIHRILARDTADEIQKSALAGKADEEMDLMATINQYRLSRR